MLDKKRAVTGAYFKLLTCSNAVISGKLGEILFSIMKSPILHFAPIMYQVVCTIGMKSVNVRQCNGPFAGSGHTVLNKLHWDANNVVGLPKQRNSYQSSLPFLCFESPTALFASQCCPSVIYSVPCDRIL